MSRRNEKAMKKGLFVVGTLLVSALVASATDADKYEAFAGYSFVRFNPNSDCSASSCGSFLPHFNSHGGDGQFEYHLYNHFGVALDVGALTKGTFNQTAIDPTRLNFLARPQYTYRHND